MNIPVKVTPPERVRRPWMLGAIIAALLAVAVVISLYEFSPEFRLAVGYRLVDDEFCVTKNVSVGVVTVKCYEKRSGWGYCFVTSEGFYVQIDRPDFQSTTYLAKFTEITDDERRTAERYALDEALSEDVLRGMMSNWCSSWDYSRITREKKHGIDFEPFVLRPWLQFTGSDERHAYFSVDMWGMNTVRLTLNRATGEITACAPTVYSP